MQSLLQAALMGVITAFLCVLLRSMRPEYAFVTGAAGSLATFAMALPALKEAVAGLMQISVSGAISESIAMCLQAAAVVLLCEFSASICRDAGENALAGRVEFCGRAFLCAMCVPVMVSLVNSLGSLSLFS